MLLLDGNGSDRAYSKSSYSREYSLFGPVEYKGLLFWIGSKYLYWKYLLRVWSIVDIDRRSFQQRPWLPSCFEWSKSPYICSTRSHCRSLRPFKDPSMQIRLLRRQAQQINCWLDSVINIYDRGRSLSILHRNADSLFLVSGTQLRRTTNGISSWSAWWYIERNISSWTRSDLI